MRSFDIAEKDNVTVDVHHLFKFKGTPFGIEWWKTIKGVWNMVLITMNVPKVDKDSLGNFLFYCLPKEPVVKRSYFDIADFMDGVNGISPQQLTIEDLVNASDVI